MTETTPATPTSPAPLVPAQVRILRMILATGSHMTHDTAMILTDGRTLRGLRERGYLDHRAFRNDESGEYTVWLYSLTAAGLAALYAAIGSEAAPDVADRIHAAGQRVTAPASPRKPAPQRSARKAAAKTARKRKATAGGQSKRGRAR